LRLLREIHAELLKGVRGEERQPGEFRTTQNWIGPSGCTLNQAEFVPPPPHEMQDALANLERFLHERNILPVLVHCAVAHAQFETIHPFLDGNGRVGRLLIALLLCERAVLQKPLLYLSYYLKSRRLEYYDRLMAIRTDGDWEGWIKFFLKGVFEVSKASTMTARAILDLRERFRSLLTDRSNALRLLDHLFESPIITMRLAEKYLGCSYVTATRVVGELKDVGVLVEATGWHRNRRYRFKPYLDLFERQANPPGGADNE
jgi:Fic family protein